MSNSALTIPSFDQFPNDTRLYHPKQNIPYLTTKGLDTCDCPYLSVYGREDDFRRGSIAYTPDSDSVSRPVAYVKDTDRGPWLLVFPTSEHFLQVDNRGRPDLGKGGSTSEVAAPRHGALDVVCQAPASVEEGRLIQDASRALDIVTFNVSLADAKLGNVEDPDSVAFTGEFAKPQHQKACVSFKAPWQKDVLNLRQKPQINIRGTGGPFSRLKLAKRLAELLEVVWTEARKRGDPLMCSDGTEVELERIILLGVERVSKGGIKVALDFSV